MLAQRERVYNHICLNIRWLFCQKYYYNVFKRCYNDVRQGVIKGEGKSNIVWNYDFYTDRVVEYRRLDMVVLNSPENDCQIIDVSIRYNSKANSKDQHLL